MVDLMKNLVYMHNRMETIQFGFTELFAVKRSTAVA